MTARAEARPSQADAKQAKAGDTPTDADAAAIDPADEASVEGGDAVIDQPPDLKHNSFITAVFNIVASFAVVSQLLLTWETLIFTVLAAAIILGFWGLSRAVDDFSTAAEQASISFAWVSFVLTFPLSQAVSSGFTRRENALTSLSQLRGATFSLVSGACVWTLPPEPTNGQPPLPDSANGFEVALTALEGLKAMEAYLLSPIVSRARHFQIKAFMADRQCGLKYQRACQQAVVARLHKVEVAVDALRFPPRGLPPPHVSRLMQYLQLLRTAWEQLRYVKDYRQPLGLRTFSRLVILLLPFFYGPQLFAGTSTTWAIGLPLAVLTQLIFIGLFSIQRMLEDPFLSDDPTAEAYSSREQEANAQPTGLRLDSIRVRAEFAEVRAEVLRVLSMHGH